MATRLYAGLNTRFGSPLTGPALLDLVAAKRDALRSSDLWPETLNVAAFREVFDFGDLHVVVAGAGLSGLTAAWYLNRCGISVAVFEAGSRLGGRVMTDRDLIPGKTVEAGAELIGVNHALWLSLADTFGLPLVEISTEADYEERGLAVRLRIGGHDLDDDEKEQVFDTLQSAIDAIGADAFDIDPVTPWLSPGAADFDAMSVQQRLDELFDDADSLARAVFEFMLSNDNCAPVDEQSYLGLLALVSAGRVGDDTEGMRGYWEYTETHRCGGGNDLLASALGASIDGEVFFGDAITEIEVWDDRVNFTSESGSGRCDYFVLAAPPTAWPPISSEQGFDPAIYTMSHGPAVKFLTRVGSQFWVDSHLAPSALSDAIGSVWEGTDQQPTVPDFGLSVYSGGPFVLDEQGYSDQLAELYSDYAPLTEQLVDWPNTPGVMTGYSVPSPGQVTTVGQALAEAHGRLFFAGEQSYVPFFGYMEGALQAGARAAREIVRTICPDALP